MWEAGFANQPSSVAKNDGLQLIDAYMTMPVRCAPPDNKPLPAEILRCRSYLVRELALLEHVQVVVPLGGIALNAYLAILKAARHIKSLAAFPFRHGAVHRAYAEGPQILTSYHPSQQNTSTGRLTAAMLREVFSMARTLLR